MPCLSDLEQIAAAFHKAEDALVFGNGYMACLGLVGCIAQGSDDVFVVDELVHASCWDGRKMSRANTWVTFRHGDAEHMKEVLQNHVDKHRGEKRNFIVVIESVYSMGGYGGSIRKVLDGCDEIAETYTGGDISVIVDEAHACGIHGPYGEGKAVDLGLEDHPRLLARVITFGKGFGCYGAIVLGSNILKQYLLNYARTLIYTTAPPVPVVAAMRAVYDFMKTEEADMLRKELRANTTVLRSLIPDKLMAGDDGPVQAVIVRGNELCVKVASMLQRKGFAVSAIRSPTVPRNEERIRIIVHAFNDSNEIQQLVLELRKVSQTFPLRRACL